MLDNKHFYNLELNYQLKDRAGVVKKGLQERLKYNVIVYTECG